MQAIQGPTTAPMAFERLSKYIRSYHSNVVSEFRNFDKATATLTRSLDTPPP